MNYEEASKNQLVNNIILKYLNRLSYYYTREELESERDLILFKAVTTFDSTKSNFLTWVTNSSNYYVLDKLKLLPKKNMKQLMIDVAGPDIELSMFINSTLASLEPTKRAILEYKYFHGYTNKQICDMLSISRNNYFPLLKSAKEDFMEIFNAERNFSKG